MTKRSKKQCETGVPLSIIRDAIRGWAAQQVDADRYAALPGGYVSKLPAPPASGSPDWTRCIQKWYNAYMQANMMDSWLQQMGTLQGQLNSGEAILTALTAAYTDCMTGTPA
jgi:hypothetical protein